MAALQIPEIPHIPVMLDEVKHTLMPAAGEVYVDGTFGAGGYTTAILDAADCRVIAIDRDEDALANGAAIQKKYGNRIFLKQGCFGDAASIVKDCGFEQVDGFVLDLGVSSMQLDQAARGFSFRFDGPLDMRMDQRGNGLTAADIVNNWKEDEIADVIYRYGEDRHSRRIAKAIVAQRAQGKITRTSELADIIRKVVPRTFKDKTDPATRTFQGLRIAVNAELEELERALAASIDMLKPGGRLVVVSFHSLEDRIVKNFMQEKSGTAARGSRHLPQQQETEEAPAFILPSRKALFPSDEESEGNPRARSARLRVAVRSDAKEQS